jgi:NodT family efflux transporter outer membrane factor (OMF) lipoprotein
VSAADLSQWWRNFDDPLLVRLVEQALQSNNSIQSARAALQQARALRDVSAAGLLPSISSSASAQRSQAGSGGTSTSTGGGGGTSSFRAGLDASWEPDFFGALQSGLDSSEATAAAVAADLGDTQMVIAAETALTYISLRGAELSLGIARANLASQRETLQITEWRMQAGLVTTLEVEQATTAAEQTAAQLPSLQTRLAQSRHALALLTGQPPTALDALLGAGGPVPQAATDLALSGPAETLRQRPDVRAAELRVRAAAARVAQADAARLPSFSLSGSLGLSALSLGTLGNGSALLGTVLAGVALPIFDGGGLNAQLRAQQAALVQAQLAHRSSVLTALLDVEDALVALQGDRERLVRLSRAANSAANAEQLARQRYSSGLVDFQTVLETQRSLLSTQDSLATTRTQVSADHVLLYKALGGGWRPANLAPPLIPTDNADRTISP